MTLDCLLIEKVFEKIGFYFQVRWDINAKRLSRFFIYLYGTTALLRAHAYWRPDILPPNFPRVDEIDLVFTIILTSYCICQTIKSHLQENILGESDTQVLNSNKVSRIHTIARIFSIFAVIFTPFEVIGKLPWSEATLQCLAGTMVVCWAVITACFLYFDACDILPRNRLRALVPATSKVKP